MARLSRVNNLISTLFIGFVMIAIPLYYENGYLNMLEAKWHIYLIGSFVLVTAMIICQCRTGLSLGSVKRMSILDMLILAFGINAIISCALSSNAIRAFMGSDGWHIGGYTIISLVIAYFYLGTHMKNSSMLWAAVIIVNLLIIGVAVAHSMDYDLLNLHAGSYEPHYYRYMSTLGNNNWTVGYSSLLYPLFLTLFIKENDSRRLVLLTVILAAFSLLMVLAGSDGMYLMLGFISIFIIPLAFAGVQNARRTGLAIAMLGVSLLMVGGLDIFMNKRYEIDDLSKLFTTPWVATVIIAVGIGIYLAFSKLGHKLGSENTLKRIVIGLETILGALIAYMLYSAYRSFDVHWGTGRGMTWTGSIELYNGFSLKEKLWGLGPEMLKEPYRMFDSFFKLPIYVSHSEPLQILLTMGAIGLIIWIAICLVMTYTYFKNRLWGRESSMYLLPVLGYIGQSLVNSAMTTNVCILIVMLACFRKCFRDEAGAGEIKEESVYEE